jgi:hypothetical protein
MFVIHVFFFVADPSLGGASKYLISIMQAVLNHTSKYQKNVM